MANHKTTPSGASGLICTFVCLSALFFSTAVLAVDEFALDIDFANALMEYEFYDYAQLHINQMTRKYRDKKDAIAIETARLFYNTGKQKEADKLLNGIPETSEFYSNALVLKAEVSFARRKFADAAKAFDQYFKKNTKPPKGRAGQEQYKRSVMFYSRVLKELGKSKEAGAIIAKLNDLKGVDMDDRQMTFMELSAILDGEEQKLDEKKPMDTGAVNKAAEGMKSLQFERDGVGASSYIQYARALILLGRNAANNAMRAKKPADLKRITYFKQAIKTIKTVDSFLVELEKATHGDHDKSPVAEAMFYKAYAIQNQAVATHFGGDKAMGQKQLLAAAKYYQAMLEEYPNMPLRTKAVLQYSRIVEQAKKLYNEDLPPLEGGDSDTINAKIEQAEALFTNKDYASCIPIYLEAVRAGRRSRKLPDVVMRLVIAYAMEDGIPEASALVSYVADAMPTADNSAEAAYRLGGVLYQRAKDEQNPARQEELNSEAVRFWDIFVNLNPAHPKAADVAYAIAELQYKKAADLAKQSEEVADIKQKQELQKRAILEFMAAIPKYQRLTETFSSFANGIRGYYKLGWIYYTINNTPKELRKQIVTPENRSVLEQDFTTVGAEAFNQYFEKESDEKFGDDRLEARFRAGELLLFGENPQDAIPVFQDIAAIFAGKGKELGIATGTKRAQGIKENAASYMPWAFDLAGEKAREPGLAFQEQQQSIQMRIRALEKEKAATSEKLAAIGKEGEEEAEATKNLDSIIAELSLDFKAIVEAQLKDKFEAAQKMANGAEKQKELEELKAQLAQRSEGLQRQKTDTVKGNILSNEEEAAACRKEQSEANAAKTAAEKALADAKAALAAHQADLAARQKRIDADIAKIKAVEKDSVTYAAEQDNLNAEIEKLTASLDEAKNKDKIQRDINALKNKLEEVTQKADVANGIKSSLEAADSPDSIKAQETALAERKAQKPALDENITRAANAIKDAEARIALVATRLAFIAEKNNVDKKTAEILAKPEAERKEAAKALVKLGPGLRDAWNKVLAATKGYRELRAKELQRIIDSTDKNIQEQKGALAKIDEQLKPINAEVEKWKRQAITHFEAFFKAFPKSPKAADNLARLGTVYMGLGENDKATQALTQLAERFPDSKANRTARFNLGRAQMDSGNAAQAAQTFREILRNPATLEALTPANLSFIIDTGVSANAPDVASAAAARLIALAAKPDSGISNQLRDKAFVRCAENEILQQKYDSAIHHIEELLKLNPKTAYLFDAQFALADANARRQPPDTAAAIAALEAILQYAEAPNVTNRALCQLGDLLVTGTPEQRKQAAARYQLVALLGDAKDAESRPWIEKATVSYAQLLKQENELEKLKRLIDQYRRNFPEGHEAAKLEALLR